MAKRQTTKRQSKQATRDRVVDFRRVRAGDLLPHPDNWRDHPDKQRDALRELLADVGYVDALIVRKLPGGKLQLIDGHLRAETTPNDQVPVLVVDLDDAETAKVLATFDPLAAMAETSGDKLDALLQSVKPAGRAVATMLKELQRAPGPPAADAATDQRKRKRSRISFALDPDEIDRLLAHLEKYAPTLDEAFRLFLTKSKVL